MPTYGYRCRSCDQEFDAFQKMSDQTRAKCPTCGKRGERLISGGAGIVFKGSGFYETDYKRAKPPAGDKTSDAGKDKAAPEKKPKTNETGASKADPKPTSNSKKGNSD